MVTFAAGSFADVAQLLAWGRTQGLYSAAAWSAGAADGELTGGVLGTRSWDGPGVGREDLFDLASVTKPVVGLAVMALVEGGVLGLQSTVGDLLPSFRSSTKATLTLRDLMRHTSGMPGQVPLYRTHSDRQAMVAALRDLPLLGPPGEAVRYSSQGMMLVGFMAEAASGRALDRLVQDYVCEPAGLGSTGFSPGAADRARAVATEDCAWRGRLVQGEVHDENAVVLGGVAAHAGLFSTIEDMSALGRALVRNLDHRVLVEPSTLAVMTENATSRLGHGRGLTWQSSVAPDSPAGHRVSPETFGHTGFTGTSLYIDPRARRYYVLLTNRVHPSRETAGMARIRQEFHDLAARL